MALIQEVQRICQQYGISIGHENPYSYITGQVRQSLVVYLPTNCCLVFLKLLLHYLFELYFLCRKAKFINFKTRMKFLKFELHIRNYGQMSTKVPGEAITSIENAGKPVGGPGTGQNLSSHSLSRPIAAFPQNQIPTVGLTALRALHKICMLPNVDSTHTQGGLAY